MYFCKFVHKFIIRIWSKIYNRQLNTRNKLWAIIINLIKLFIFKNVKNFVTIIIQTQLYQYRWTKVISGFLRFIQGGAKCTVFALNFCITLNIHVFTKMLKRNINKVSKHKSLKKKGIIDFPKIIYQKINVLYKVLN